MSDWKATVLIATADGARTITGYLTELLEPPADAVTSFEEPSGGVRVEAYFTHKPDETGLRSSLRELGVEAVDNLAVNAIAPENWVAKVQAGLPPVEAGRFIVHGSHDRARASYRLHAIEIDAGEAFGTAHHATTLGCLHAIDRLAHVSSPANILDLGCGSGVLAIAAAFAWPRAAIVATDYDPIAVDVAHQNAIQNGVGKRVAFAVARGFAHRTIRQRRPFDLIVANILAAPLVALAPEMAQSLGCGGRLVLSGILAQQAAEVRAAYAGCGMAIERHDCQNGWATLTMVKRGP